MPAAAATPCRSRSSWAGWHRHAGPRQRSRSQWLPDRTTPRILQPRSSRSTDPERAENASRSRRASRAPQIQDEGARVDEIQMGYERAQLQSNRSAIDRRAREVAYEDGCSTWPVLMSWLHSQWVGILPAP